MRCTVLAYAAALALAAAPAGSANGASASFFVKRCGTQLCVNGRPYRFAGANVYWLGLDENVGGIAYPTPFRVVDTLTTASVFMGATVIRSHTLGISVGNPLSFEPTLGVFNDSALDAADYAVFFGAQRGVRFIVPLVDEWNYYHGGRFVFAGWFNTTADAFWTDPDIIAAFKTYIQRRLTHVNRYTGLAYIDDPAIMAWETGNELSAPSAWTSEIAAFIKSIDSNHLVLDGTYGINAANLNDSSIDMYSDHFYPVDTARLLADGAAVAAAGKVFVAGEYGWTGAGVAPFQAAAASCTNVSVLAYWSLFGHSDAYGFEQHSDGYTVHYPGDDAAMAAAVAALTNNTYAITGVAPPSPLPMPATPIVTLASVATNRVAWSGAAGAATYTVQTSTSGSGGPFTTVCDRCATDNDTPVALSPPLASGMWLRVQGVGVTGVTGMFSNAVQAQ